MDLLRHVVFVDLRMKKLKLSDRYWICPNCKTFLDRDLNASINILKYGYQSSGDLTDVEVEVTKPMKRLEFLCH